MTIRVNQLYQTPIEEQQLEIVERKGVGHPDHICDAVMNEVSVTLSKEYLKRYGHVMHHNIDKALLAAGEVKTRFGGGEVKRPMLMVFGAPNNWRLDSGGKLFMSGMDILDQSAGTTPFASGYLHVTWNNTTDNDLPTDAAHAVGGTPVGGAAGTFPIDVADAADPSDPYCPCMDELTLAAPAEAQFTADDDRPNALAVADTSPVTGTPYKVVFFAFPVERMGTAADQAGVISRTESYFSAP